MSQGVQTVSQTCEVADGSGIRRFVDEMTGLLREVARRGAACLVTLFERVHLEGNVVELAHEVGERLLGRAVGVLADHAPDLAFAYLDGAVVGDAAHSAEVDDAAGDGAGAAGTTAAGLGAFGGIGTAGWCGDGGSRLRGLGGRHVISLRGRAAGGGRDEAQPSTPRGALPDSLEARSHTTVTEL